MIMSLRSRFAVTCGLTLLLLAGCGEPPEAPPSASSTAAPTQSPAPSSSDPSDLSDTDLPTPAAPTTPPSGPSDTIERSRISGVLERQADCDVLDGPNGRWSLLGLDARWRSGDELTVTGLARPNRATACEAVAYTVLDVRQTGT